MCSCTAPAQKAGTFCLRFTRHHCCREGRGETHAAGTSEDDTTGKGMKFSLPSAKSCPKEMKNITSPQPESLPLGNKASGGFGCRSQALDKQESPV